MSKQHYTVMIAGIAKSGMGNYVKDFLVRLMKASRKEEGCLIYNIHQSINNPDEFMVYMIWENEQAFEKHNQSAEMQEFKKKLSSEMFEFQSPKTYWHLLD